MATVHLRLSERQDSQIKQLMDKLGAKRPAVLAMALKAFYDLHFPPQPAQIGTNQS